MNHHHPRRQDSSNGRNNVSDEDLPTVDSIHQGRVVRVEAYGAFVELQSTRNRGRQGLVHISQLANMRVERVVDVVQVDDTVWVKVLEVEPLDNNRYKIRLSMKGIPQDGTAFQAHQAQQHANALTNTLESSLNSNIGIAFARDPMETAAGSRIVYKNSSTGAGDKQQHLINGYALVPDEDEDNAEVSSSSQKPGSNPDGLRTDEKASAPTGRGRGATIPAWMVKQQRLGETDDSDQKRNNKKKKKHKSHDKKKKKKHSSKRSHHYDDEENRRSRKRSRHHRRHYRSRSSSRSRSMSSRSESS